MRQPVQHAVGDPGQRVRHARGPEGSRRDRGGRAADRQDGGDARGHRDAQRRQRQAHDRQPRRSSSSASRSTRTTPRRWRTTSCRRTASSSPAQIPRPPSGGRGDNRARMLRRVAAPLVLCPVARRLRRRRRRVRRSPPKATPSTAPAPKLIRRNPANASTTLTIGSKNFTEEFILGEIYAQALKAGGYKVRKQLDYGSELVALQGRQGRQARRLPGVHRHGADDVLRRRAERDPQGRAGGLRGGQGRLRQERGDRAPADAVHGLQRGRR